MGEKMRRTKEEMKELYNHTLTVLQEVGNEKGRNYTFKAKDMAERVGLSSWVLCAQLEQLVETGHVEVIAVSGKRCKYRTLFKKSNMLIKLKDGGYLFSDDGSNENPLKYLIH